MTEQVILVDKITPLTREEACRALGDALRSVTGSLPTVPALAVFAGQCALETGHWKSCHWHNWGNVKAGSTSPLVTFFGCSEILDGKERWFHPPEDVNWPHHDAWIRKHPTSQPSRGQCRWRAFRTAEQGALEHVRFLGVDSNGDGRNRYAAAFAAALDGDAERYARELKLAGYYTASASQYAKTLTQLASVYAEPSRLALEQLSAAPERHVQVESAPSADYDSPSTVAARDAILTAHMRQIELGVPWDEIGDQRKRDLLEDQ